MSGLAFMGMIGVAEMINHSGGFIKKRSDDPGKSAASERLSQRKRRRKRRRKSRKNKKPKQLKKRKRRKRPLGMLMSERERDDDDDNDDGDFYENDLDYADVTEPVTSLNFYDDETTTVGNLVDRRFLYTYPDWRLPETSRRKRKLKNSNRRKRRRKHGQTLDRYYERPYFEYATTNPNEFDDYPEYQYVPAVTSYQFKNQPLNYDNYDVDDYGNIDMDKAKAKEAPLQPSNQVSKIYLTDETSRISGYSFKQKRDSDEGVVIPSDKRPRDDTSDYVYVDAGSGDFKDFLKRVGSNSDFTPLDYDNYETDQDGNIDLSQSSYDPAKPRPEKNPKRSKRSGVIGSESSAKSNDSNNANADADVNADAEQKPETRHPSAQKIVNIRPIDLAAIEASGRKNKPTDKSDKPSDRTDEEPDYIYVDINGVDYTSFRDILDGPGELLSPTEKRKVQGSHPITPCESTC